MKSIIYLTSTSVTVRSITLGRILKPHLSSRGTRSVVNDTTGKGLWYSVALELLPMNVKKNNCEILFHISPSELFSPMKRQAFYNFLVRSEVATGVELSAFSTY